MNLLLQKPKKISTLGILAYYNPVRQIVEAQQGQQLLDYSGLGNHANLGSTGDSDNNDPTWESNDLNYDTDDYTSHPLGIFNPTSGTFEVVMNPVSNYGGLRVLGSDHSAGTSSEIRTFANATVLFGLTLFNGTTSAIANASLVYGSNLIYTCSWHYNGVSTIMRSYLNGNPKNVVNLLGQAVAPDIALYMGYWPGTSYSRFKLYRSLFYGRQLSAPEIWDNYVAHKRELKVNGVILT